MTPENREANAVDEINRGNQALAAARVLHDAELHSDAVSRAYYAAYHWASALLLSKGIEPRTHRGKIRMIGLHFVRPGLLDEEPAAELSRLGDYRELSDYTAGIAFTRQDAAKAIERAETFIAACRPLLPSP